MAFLVLMAERCLIIYHLSGSKSLVLNVLPFNSEQPQTELRSKFQWFDCKTDTFNHQAINTTWFKHFFDDESIYFTKNATDMYFLEQAQYFHITFVGSWTFLRSYKP